MYLNDWFPAGGTIWSSYETFRECSYSMKYVTAGRRDFEGLYPHPISQSLFASCLCTNIFPSACHTFPTIIDAWPPEPQARNKLSSLTSFSHGILITATENKPLVQTLKHEECWLKMCNQFFFFFFNKAVRNSVIKYSDPQTEIPTSPTRS